MALKRRGYTFFNLACFTSRLNFRNDWNIKLKVLLRIKSHLSLNSTSKMDQLCDCENLDYRKRNRIFCWTFACVACNLLEIPWLAFTLDTQQAAAHSHYIQLTVVTLPLKVCTQDHQNAYICMTSAPYSVILLIHKEIKISSWIMYRWIVGVGCYVAHM